VKWLATFGAATVAHDTSFQTDGKPEQIIFSKEKLLTDPFDDLLIRSFVLRLVPARSA